MIIPRFQLIVVDLNDFVTVQRSAESEGRAVTVGLHFGQQINRSACVADSLKAAVVDGTRHPAFEASEIKMAILFVESATMNSRCKCHWQFG